MDIYFNGVEYKPTEKEVEEITFLGTKTIQAKVKNNLTHLLMNQSNQKAILNTYA